MSDRFITAHYTSIFIKIIDSAGAEICLEALRCLHVLLEDGSCLDSEWYLLLLLSSQLHLLLLFLQQQGGHVSLLRVGSQELLPQTAQLVDHHQQLKLLLCQRLRGTWNVRGPHFSESCL